MRDSDRKCRGKRADGDPCHAAVASGSDYCFFHDPDRAEERREAQALGGSRNRMKTLATDAPDVTVGTCEDVVRLLAKTINQVRRGEIDPRVANAVGYLANVLIRALEQGEIEARLAALEAALAAPRPASQEVAP